MKRNVPCSLDVLNLQLRKASSLRFENSAMPLVLSEISSLRKRDVED